VPKKPLESWTRSKRVEISRHVVVVDTQGIYKKQTKAVSKEPADLLPLASLKGRLVTTTLEH
jgi:hypothetical protein